MANTMMDAFYQAVVNAKHDSEVRQMIIKALSIKEAKSV